MEEEGGPQKGVTAAFPPPPPFWKHFSPLNLDKLAQLKQEAEPGRRPESKKWSPTALRDLELPPDLRCLVPPALPTTEYTLFGEAQSLSPNPPSLEEQGIEQLFPSSLMEGGTGGRNQPSNHAYYLTKIAKSLLLNFLEFVGVLSICPEQFESKIEDLRNLFINAHHLLNLYRPHQARESLILMMEEQLQKSREEIQEMDNMKGRVEEFLTNLKAEGEAATRCNDSIDPEPNAKVRSVKKGEEEELEEFRTMWQALDEISDG